MRLNVISSSFSAFEQIELSRKKSRKYVWMFILFLATLLAFYQTALVIDAYFGLSKKHFDSQEINTELMMATICANKYEYVTEGNEDIFLKLKRVNSDCDPTFFPSLFCLSLLTERERFRVGFPIQNYLLLYNNPMIDSIVQFQFNNLLFGNCLTIQMNLLRQGVLALFPSAISQQDLHMVVHENGTPPVFNLENEIKVNGNTYAALTSKVIYHESFRNKKDGCVDEDWKEIQAIGSVNPNITKFKYTLEYCLDQCIHQLTKTYCKCILPKTMQDDNADKLPICGSQICNKIPVKESEEMCNCKPTCRSVKFSSIKRDFSVDSEDLRLSSLIHDWPSDQEMDVDGLLRANKEKRMKPGHLSILVLRSILTTIKTYEPLIKLEDAFSTIGGIWGLWMGLSVSILLSLLSDFLFNNKYLKLSTKYHRFLSISKNMFWLPSILAILLICFYQTYVTIVEYQQFKVISVITTEEQDANYFPTVYVCSFENNMYYDEEKLNSNPQFKEKVDRLLASKERMPIQEFRHYFSTNSTYEERLLLVPDLKKRNIAKCEFRSERGISHNCHIKIIIFETGFLDLTSTCAIIKLNDSNNGVKIKNLHLELKFSQSKIPNKVMNFVLAFHPLVIFPFDKSKQLADFVSVFPGYFVDVKYSVTKRERLGPPYTSNCSREHNSKQEYQLSTQNRTGEKYVYNLEECLWMCYSNELMHQMDFSSIMNFDYNKCGCNLPCNEINQQFKISHASHVYKQKVSQRHFNNISDLENFLWSGPAIINIERESSHMTVITDHPAVQDDSLVGIIGGLSGLWIGQSILTLLVEMHTFLHAVSTRFMRKKK